MKKYLIFKLILVVILMSLLSCRNDTVRLFKAVGNSDPDHRAPKRKRGEVVVTFDLLPAKMSFNLPSFPCLVTENNISFYNGWTETYDEAAGDGSCEPLMDFDNVYSRMWIESQNDARIVVPFAQYGSQSCGHHCFADFCIRAGYKYAADVHRSKNS